MSKAKAVAAPAKKPTNTVAMFRRENIPSVRIPALIREGFAKMKAQKVDWLSNIDFSRLTGVNASELNNYAPQFEAQTHEMGSSSRPKFYWFVSPAAKEAALKPE